jgi:hydroxymethylglutaryl-CoA lyase
MKLIECPRDAMQGIRTPIPTEAKIRYLTQLMAVGFHTLDCGSFVSPKVIPQMQDTPEVLRALADHPGDSRRLVIVANRKGARQALAFEGVDDLGYPFSVSEIFMRRNANRSIEEAATDLRTIGEWCAQSGKRLVAYVSMGFGNPYGEAWSVELVLQWVERLVATGIQTISLSDTVGNAKASTIEAVFGRLVADYPQVEFGAHLHAHPQSWFDKVEAAYRAGCRRFDGALKGYGGCPLAEDQLVGNLPTEGLWQWMRQKGEAPLLNESALESALHLSGEVFGETEAVSRGATH